jgi:hypothetical protein
VPLSGAPTPPIMPEQPSMYDVSRSLRLMLEAPRRIAKTIKRASEAVSGATDLVNGMQDPRVRRNAMAGLRHAVTQHEEQRGPLAPVAPLARAVIAFTEPLESELPQNQQAESRRIQVRAAVRDQQSPPPAAEPVARPVPAPPPAEGQPEIRATAAVRRSIAVRKVNPEPSAEPEQVAPIPIDRGQVSTETVRPAVRRIVVSREE